MKNSVTQNLPFNRYGLIGGFNFYLKGFVIALGMSIGLSLSVFMITTIILVLWRNDIHSLTLRALPRIIGNLTILVPIIFLLRREIFQQVRRGKNDEED